jgi:hypothetical protein
MTPPGDVARGTERVASRSPAKGNFMNASARLTTLTRMGFATRGLLYIVIAVLIIRTGRVEDTNGALQYVGEGAGRVLLVIMAAGLFAYGLWRLADAAFDIERHGSDRKALAERTGAAVSGVVHLALTWQAVRLIRGLQATGDGTQAGTQTALDLPGGTVIVIVAALAVFAMGAIQMVKAVKGGFLRYLEPRIAQQPLVQWSGRVGYAARGVVFVIVAWLLVRAGLSESASQAGGMARALSWLTSPADIIIAVGLFGFGLFSLVEARFRTLHDVPVAAVAQRATGGR